MAKRRTFTDHFKAKAALEALRGDRTVQEIAATHQVHLFPAGHCAGTSREAHQVSTWKRQAGENDVFVFRAQCHWPAGGFEQTCRVSVTVKDELWTIFCPLSGVR